MNTTNELLITLLLDLVERVPDLPKRVLFKGVSNLYEGFKARAQPGWKVCVTQEGVDVVGARNDPTINVLVVFYRAEVRERESLNAFRLYNEDEIAKELVGRLVLDTSVSGLRETYDEDERRRLALLLDMVYPSVERLAEFLLAGKAQLGESLPPLGLFCDPDLRLDMPIRQWSARLRENQQVAVLRWRDFLRRGIHTKPGRQILRDERVSLLRKAEVDPAKRQDALAGVTLNEALSVLNPPNRLVQSMMAEGFTRGQSEKLVADLKSTQVEHVEDRDRILRQLLQGLPTLSDAVQQKLKELVTVQEEGGDGGEPVQPSDLRRVGFCLEGLLRLAGEKDIVFPNHLRIRRTGRNGEHEVVVQIKDGRLQIAWSDDDAARFLSVPGASGVSELEYEVCLPDDRKYRFTLGVLPHWLEKYAEDWLDEAYWQQAQTLNPAYADRWRALQNRVQALIRIVDPDWHQEQTEEEKREPTDREPNNPIYAIFDLLYFAHRKEFDAFLDEWLVVAMLPWQDTEFSDTPAWNEVVTGLLQLGTAKRSDGKTVIFPFYPLRLAWYREVFRQIESWLVQAITNKKRLVFEPGVMSAQLRPFDRPRALFDGNRRLVEAVTESFFIAQFVPEEQHQQARPPLYRAQQKLHQFGQMWPFSLDRLHLTFQPGDAGEDIYRLLVQESDIHPSAAYHVRALVKYTGMMTVFDRQLLSTSEETVDLMTQEHHESILPRVDYAKGLIDPEGYEDNTGTQAVSAHIALLVDAFGEDRFGFGQVVGQLKKNPDWFKFSELLRQNSVASRQRLTQVDLAAPPYHIGTLDNVQRLVYVPFVGGEPEYLRMLYDCLMAWEYQGAFNEGVYYEQVCWDAEQLQRMHEQADWVLLFDRTLDKSLFGTLTGVKLIDYYPNLPGGYKMSVSSQRTEAVKWQLAQVLQQFFPHEGLDVLQVAERMLDTLSQFASGLLLKTLGGGSLAQELLGLYATYLSLIDEGVFVPGQDWLIPLDDYQSWFGRRTRRGRRADLMVLNSPTPDVLRLIGVESKWYVNRVGRPFVRDEFGEGGQMRVTITNLRSLFDPTQERLDKHYWQKTLASLLDNAPDPWSGFRKQFGASEWRLEVDGIVYVHQYQEQDTDGLHAHNEILLAEVTSCIDDPADKSLFGLDPDFRRLRLKARNEIARLFAQAGDG